MKCHLAIYFHLSRNCLYCQSSLTSAILSHIGLGGLPRAARISGPGGVPKRGIQGELPCLRPRTATGLF